MTEEKQRNLLLSSIAFNMATIRPLFFKNIPVDLLQEYLPALSESILKIYVPCEFISPLKSITKNMTLLELKKAQELGARVISLFDLEYPPELRQIPDPPPILYLLGNPLSTKKRLSIVGPRKPSGYGIDVTQYVMERISQYEMTIVSGLALGIDALAHKLALKFNMNTIAILGTGINVPYPASNYYLYKQIKECGTIISEFPLNTPGFKYNFPRRNRIIAGISEGTLVIEAGEKSGSLITASFARDFGKDVFAIPGNIFSSSSRGTNKLIEEGAKPIMCEKGILNERIYSLVARRNTEGLKNNSPTYLSSAFSEDMLRNLLTFLMNPKPIDIIIDFCKEKNYRITTSLLTILEIEGLIAKTTDNFFYKVGCSIDEKSSNCRVSGKSKTN